MFNEVKKSHTQKLLSNNATTAFIMDNIFKQIGTKYYAIFNNGYFNKKTDHPLLDLLQSDETLEYVDGYINVNGVKISKETINETSNLMFRFHDTINLPFYPRIFETDGLMYLNSWRWCGIDYNDYASLDKGIWLLHQIYYLICGGLNTLSSIEDMNSIEYYLDILINKNIKNEYDKQFYIILHWFAERYQNPLLSAKTCLILISDAQNIGKTSLSNIFGRIIDKDYTRSMDKTNFMNKNYHDGLEKPGIIDVSDIKDVSPSLFDASIKERVRTSTSKRQFNIKGKEMFTGYYHPSFVFSMNNTNPLLCQRGQTTRLHIIEGITDEIKNHKIEMVNVIIGKVVEYYNNGSFDGEYLEGISMLLDNIIVDTKVMSNSDNLQTNLLTNLINNNVDEFEQILRDNADWLKSYTRQRELGWTREMSISKWYDLFCTNMTSFSKQYSKSQFKAMITKEVNKEYVEKMKTFEVKLKIID